MRETIVRRLAGKHLVTLVLTGVFSYLAVPGKMRPEFMAVCAVVIAFYFGTQYQMVQDLLDRQEDANGAA